MFFTLLGVIFFIIMTLIGYVWLTDWWGVRSIVESLSESSQKETGDYIHTIPSSSTLEELETKLKTGEMTLTESQLECLREKLGNERVIEIYETGQEPTTREVMIGLTCL